MGLSESVARERPGDSTVSHRLTAAIATITVMLVTPCVHAYRPFDSTDASVATTGDLELELGPLGYLRTGARSALVAPSVIINLGIARHWEVILQGRDIISLHAGPGEARVRVVDTGLFAKGVLHEGSLQGRRGPSLATEVGVLLPTLRGEPGVGLSGVIIVSQRWWATTLHINGALSLTRAGTADLFGGAILEGPMAWLVRPVVEGFVDREISGSTVVSGLVGIIWRLSDLASLDSAFRTALSGSVPIHEARLGLTWTMPIARSSP